MHRGEVMAQWVKHLPCKREHWVRIPRAYMKVHGMECVCNPAAPMRRQAEADDSLGAWGPGGVSISEQQGSACPQTRKKVKTHTWDCPLTSTQASWHTHILVDTHTHIHAHATPVCVSEKSLEVTMPLLEFWASPVPHLVLDCIFHWKEVLARWRWVSEIQNEQSWSSKLKLQCGPQVMRTRDWGEIGEAPYRGISG